jgi:hypothetical protein
MGQRRRLLSIFGAGARRRRKNRKGKKASAKAKWGALAGSIALSGIEVTSARGWGDRLSRAVPGDRFESVTPPLRMGLGSPAAMGLARAPLPQPKPTQDPDSAVVCGAGFRI